MVQGQQEGEGGCGDRQLGQHLPELGIAVYRDGVLVAVITLPDPRETLVARINRGGERVGVSARAVMNFCN